MATPYRLVAGMATMPSRAHTAPVALHSLLGQFDAIYLVLNGYREVPPWADRPGVTAVISPDGHDLGAGGKLLGVSRETASSDLVYFCVDDDIRYPRNFAARLSGFLLQRSRVLVGVHGSVIRQPFRSWRDDRKKYSVNRTVLKPKQVDVVATCGCAFFPADFGSDLHHWPEEYRNCVDLYLAKLATQRGVQSWIVPRYPGWLRELEKIQEDSIYRGLLQDDSRHVALALELLKLKGKIAV